MLTNAITANVGRSRVARRDFLKTASGVVLSVGAATSFPDRRIFAEARDAPEVTSDPESLVKVLHETLSPAQRETICFAWDYQDPDRALLRTRVENNWDITEPYINSEFYTDDQRAIIRGIFEGIFHPEWHQRIDKQLEDDSDGYGAKNSIAIFGEPGSDRFEFVLTGRHMTVRCDGNSAKHVALGGPIFYGHAADGFHEGPDHPGNVFWPQALAANQLYGALDGKQQQQALLQEGLPPEHQVDFRGKEGAFQGLPISELSSDQKELVQDTVRMLLEPYRQTDRDEVAECLKAQGGLDACHMAFYAQRDIGNDQVWDCWRLEGPSFVWHYRGAPHVHVWVNVADSPNVPLNADG